MADMEESVPLMQVEGAHSIGMMDNDLANIMAGAGLPEKGHTPDHIISGPKPSAGTRCRRLCRRCIPFAGLCNDLTRLKKRYASDWTQPFKDGGLADVLVGSMFLLFVALAPAITFGALMEQLVNPQMSLSKSLVAAGLFQLLFTLVGGQPQIVLGVTGPVFIIETVIGMMASAMGLEYVSFRFVVAMSASAWGFIFLIGNLASYISRVPRSVEEIFNMFTAIFYLFKSIVSMARPFLDAGQLDLIAVANITHSGKNETVAVTKAFQHFASANGTLLIAIGTYTLVMTLAKFKQSRAFTRRVRWFLGSFNVPTAIILMTLIANLLFRDYPLKSLDIPASAANPASWVTLPDLSKLQNGGVPAFLLAILIGLCTHLLTFTETGICGLTLAKPETGMKKPTLFHLNILIVQTLLPLVSGVMCWPFVTGAVVRSNAHVLALQVWEDRALPGVRRRLVGIREQRISGVMIGILVFLCVFLGPYVLRLIPMGAMYGMFLFMGVSTFRGLQMVTRTRLLLQRRRYWPETSYLQAPLRVLVTFTLIEWAIVIILFALNCLTEFASLSYPSLFFPLILVFYGILRIHVLPRWSLMKDHLSTIDKGHGVEVDPPHQMGRCCSGRGGGDDDAGSELGASSYHSGKNSRHMTPVASAAGGFDGKHGGGGVASTVYEADSEESDGDTEADMYLNTDRL